MVVKGISLIAVVAMLALGIGGAAGAEEVTNRGLGPVAMASAGGPLAVQQDAAVAIEAIAQPTPGEIIGAIIGLVIAHAGIGLAEPIMNAAIAAGETALWLWQIGKNIWDASCDLGVQAEAVLGGQPTFAFICTLYPRWPF